VTFERFHLNGSCRARFHRLCVRLSGRKNRALEFGRDQRRGHPLLEARGVALHLVLHWRLVLRSPHKITHFAAGGEVRRLATPFRNAPLPRQRRGAFSLFTIRDWMGRKLSLA
jgi:hypothetical protein